MRALKPALQFSEGRSKPWSGAKLLNCFAEKADGDKVVDFAIMAIPGLDMFADLGPGAIRGIHALDDALYVVSGSQLFSVSETGAATALGIVGGNGPVRIADNGTQLAICATPIGYVFSEGILAIPENLPAVRDVAFIDSYFVWVIDGTSQCIYSALGDGTSYDPLDVIAAEGSPDNLVGIINDHRELHLFGANTDEIFYNSGGSDNAFERQGNAFVERGCLDRDSIVKIDNSVIFYGDDRIVYRLDGYSPARISTHAIEYHLRDAAYARAFTYTQEGHKFYVLTSPAGTFVYDIATGAWHERQSWNMAAWRCGGSADIWGRTILSDAFTGRLYLLNFDNYTENGETIAVEIGLPTLEASRERVTMYQFEVYCETGVGAAVDPAVDPQIMLQYSDDGGRLWSSELWRSLGRIGEYRTRAIWRRLGQFRQRQMKIRITDPVRRFVMSYFADVR